MAVSPNLNRLQVFREVVLAGSFSKAALVLKQPKSRVSRQIAGLEKEMGVQLIYRTTRQFQLTQAGRDLIDKAGPLIVELNQALEEVHREGDEMGGLIRVTVPVDIGSELMGKFCNEFTKLHPRVQFSLVVTNEFVDLVKESIDIALRIGKSKDSTLIQKKLGMIATIPLMSPNLLTRYGGVQKVENLEAIPYLAFSNRDTKKVTLKLVRGRESRNVQLGTVFSCNNFFTIRAMTIEGAGISFLPAYLVKEALQKGELVRVLGEWTTELIPVHIMVPNQKSRPERIKKFAEFLGLRLMTFL